MKLAEFIFGFFIVFLGKKPSFMKLLPHLILLIYLSNFTIFAQNFKSNYYYLGEVFDRRDIGGQAIGNIYIADSSAPKPFYLPNGTINFFKSKLESSMFNSRDPYFVNLSLKTLFYKESLDSKGMVNGQFDFSGSFFIEIGGDSITVFPFKFHAKYRRQIAETQKLIELLGTRTSELNRKLEVWFVENYAKNQKLGRHVVVNSTDFTPEIVDDDTLYFGQRKLTVNDFSPKKTKASNYAATVFTSMGYQSDVSMRNDTIVLDLQMKVYQVKGMSWILEEAKTNFVVNHEQTHFNITQLVAEKFKERLKEEILPPQDFNSRLQFLYLDYYRQINRMQNKYDSETKHGLDVIEQNIWDKKIEYELAKYLKIN